MFRKIAISLVNSLMGCISQTSYSSDSLLLSSKIQPKSLQVPRDAHVVSLLSSAGAVILGHANMSEWASVRSSKESTGYSPRGGQARNPYNLSSSPCKFPNQFERNAMKINRLLCLFTLSWWLQECCSCRVRFLIDQRHCILLGNFCTEKTPQAGLP